MNVKDYLDEVAYIDKVDFIDEQQIEVYKSKYDNSYVTQVGMEYNVMRLAHRGITEQLTKGVGFSPKDGKWYGWSHRNIGGFNIGSTCKKGDSHYIASTKKEQEEAAINFWTDDIRLNVRNEGVVEQEGEKFYYIKWEFVSTLEIKKLRNTTGGSLYHIKPLGRGEWTAKTMEDAKQMAVDFNK